MKNTIKVLVLALSILVTSTASASWYDSGRFFGTTFQNGMDLTGDGLNGRSGYLRVRNSVFSYMDVNIDTGVVGLCEGGLMLQAAGELVLFDWVGYNSLRLSFDEEPFCSASPETLALTITGGRGSFTGVTGTASVTLPDEDVLNWTTCTFEDQSGCIDTVLGPLPGPRSVATSDGTFQIYLD